MYTDLKKGLFRSLNGPKIWHLVKKKKKQKKKKKGENGFLIPKKSKIKYP